MSKRIESGLVVAIGALTVLTTATVIHDQNSGQKDPVSRWMNSTVRRVESFINHSAVTTVTQSPAGVPNAPQSPSVVGTNRPVQSGRGVSPPASGRSEPSPHAIVGGGFTPLPKTTAKAALRKPSQAAGQLGLNLGSKGWSAADIQTLDGIVTQLVSSMSTSDWTTLEQALSSSSSAQAESEVMQVLNSHLSASDKEWLLAHFQGNTAFSKVDIELLQQAVSELRNDLTSGEQQLIQQQVGQFFTAPATSRN